MTRIKICGLSRLEDVAGVNAAMPDFAGFVMNVPGSRRSIGIETLKRLSPALDPAIIPVGLLADWVRASVSPGTLQTLVLRGYRADDPSLLKIIGAELRLEGDTEVGPPGEPWSALIKFGPEGSLQI